MPVTLRPLSADAFEAAFALGGADDRAEAWGHFQRFPDLFVAAFDGDALVGVCYGWPFFEARSGAEKLFLGVIAVAPERQRAGIGSRLLGFWEAQAARRGAWTVSIGSAADVFYAANGCHPTEYCLKTHGAPADVRYFPVRPDDPPGTLAALRAALGADDGLMIYEKAIPAATRS